MREDRVRQYIKALGSAWEILPSFVRLVEFISNNHNDPLLR